MKKAIIIVFITSILIKITGFIKELILSYYFGASYITDAFIVSLTIPGVIFSFIGVGITTSYIPIYNKIIKEDNSKTVLNDYMNNLINFIILFCSIIFIISFIFMEYIIGIIAIGFSGEVFKLAVDFSRINIISIFFMGLIYIYNAYYQANNKFFIPSFVVLIFNVVSSIFIYFGFKYNIKLLVVGNVVALGIQLLIMLISIKKNVLKYKCELNVNDKYFKKTILMALPLLISTSVSQINVLIDRTLASNIIQGGISALNYANKLNLVINGTVVMAMTTVVFPKISTLASNFEDEKVNIILDMSIKYIVLILAPITIGTMIFSKEIVKILFGRGTFDSSAISLTAGALFFYSISMMFLGIREIITRVYYSYGDTKTPTINAIIGVIINIVLNLILSNFMGINGLALATSLSIVFTTILLLINSKLTKQYRLFKTNVVFYSRIISTSIFMGIITKYFFELLIKNYNLLVSFILTVFIGSLIYFSIIFYFYKKQILDLISSFFFYRRNFRKGE